MGASPCPDVKRRGRVHGMMSRILPKLEKEGMPNGVSCMRSCLSTWQARPGWRYTLFLDWALVEEHHNADAIRMVAKI